MQFGRFEIFQLSDGLFELGKHFMHELGGEESLPKIGRRRLVVAINPVLLRTEDAVILCDTGLGTKHKEQPCILPNGRGASGGVLQQLQSLGVAPEDVTHVILTHLHYDHAGGLTCLDREGNLIPAFPNARVFVQNEEWEAAQKALYQNTKAYKSENWGIYQDSPKLHLLDGDDEILPGVKVIKTNGHTAGHEVILVDGGDGQRAGIFGDIIPTPGHFNPGLRMKFDFNPEVSQQWRKRLIVRALEENWLLFFYHAPVVRAGYGYRRQGETVKVKKANLPELEPPPAAQGSHTNSAQKFKI